jgi:hypothetical protein
MATGIDPFSRRLLMYAISEHHDTQLIVASLNMATAAGNSRVDRVIFHSDRGSTPARTPGRPPATFPCCSPWPNKHWTMPPPNPSTPS